MAQSIQAIIDCEVVQSRKNEKNGKKLFFHRALVTDGFGVKDMVDIFSTKEAKVGPQKLKVAIGLDKEAKSGTVRGLRVMEVA